MPIAWPQPWPLITSVLADELSASFGVVVVVVVVTVVVVARAVVTDFAVVVGAVVVVATLVVKGGVVVVVSGPVVVTAIGPPAIGVVSVGSATSFAEATPASPSSANEISSRARRSTGPR
jgi:hypothetical protein